METVFSNEQINIANTTISRHRSIYLKIDIFVINVDVKDQYEFK